MVDIGKGYISGSVPRLQNIFFLNNDNRLCREDLSYIDDVVRGDGPHATENPSISLPVINFLGHHRILFADNFAISEMGTAKTRHRSTTPKGETEPKVWILYNNQYIIWHSVKSLHFLIMNKLADFSYGMLYRFDLWWDQELACWSLATLLAQSVFFAEAL